MNLQAVRGDTNVYDVTVVRQDTPINLTGAKMWFTAKSDPKAGDNAAAIALDSASNPTQIISTFPLQGKFQIALTPSNTINLADDAYYYDVQVKEANGVVTTIASGVLHIVQDVTRTTT